MPSKALRVIALIASIWSLAGAAVWFDMQHSLDKPIFLPNDTIDFEIQPGQSLDTVARRLLQNRLLHRPTYWIWEARRTNTGNRIQAGEYLIKSGQTPREILDKFVTGDVQKYEITLIDGREFNEYRKILATHSKIKQTLGKESGKSLLLRIGATEEHPEGLFFPDTYSFTRGTTDLDILQRAYRRMQEILSAEWLQRSLGLPYHTSYEALIMASIVEREAAIRDELPAIAGVYVRRLQRDMRLQADPTVIYGIGIHYDGNIRRSDLINDTPYNTYLHAGLPPTPIANPGRAAIHAALNPRIADYLYFVAKGDGSHHFSATLTDHNKAVETYQR